MKLILGNNQSPKFTDFYGRLQDIADFDFDYIDYESLLFEFDSSSDMPVMVRNLRDGCLITDYDTVFINNYYNTYELAAAVAIVAQKLAVPYANHEFSKPVSMSKLTEYARLAAAEVTIPHTWAGSKTALLHQASKPVLNQFPYVLKRANADRGIDNYFVSSYDEMAELLADHDGRSLWVLQDFVANNGYFRIGFNGGEAGFAVFRELQERPDGNAQKQHMYKPKGGANASLVELNDVPQKVLELSKDAVAAMDRQFAGVDCLYHAETDTACIIEVNYNPQLVTVEGFTEVRKQAFLKGLEQI